MEGKTIIVINNSSSEAEHAALLALRIAEKVGADLLLANEIKVNDGGMFKKHALVEKTGEVIIAEELPGNLLYRLRSYHKLYEERKVDIREIDISDFVVDDLAKMVIKNNIWMIVKVAHEFDDNHARGLHINFQYLLNKVMCPLLLVPAKFEIRDFKQIVYMADLRYCRLHIVRYLAKLSKPYGANVYIDHLSAKGLPHMEEKYAAGFFNDEIKVNVKYDKVFFNNIRERDINKALDVMINGMHIDLLAVVNHRFHFEEILGRMIPENLPEQVTIPLLIFPY